MKVRRYRSQQGIAIIIVMVSMFILAALAFAFAMSMKVENKLAVNSNNESEMEWLGRSGIEMARYVLGQELTLPGPGNRFDALNQKWAGGSGESNETLAAIALENVPLGRGKFTVKITDHERKFNINSALGNESVLQHGLILIGSDAAEIPGIIGSIQDWLDRDEDVHLNGAESAYYQTLTPPYMSKNGPIDDLSELLLVKGIAEHPEIYWGNNAANHPQAAFQAAQSSTRGAMPGMSALPVGLVDLFTAVSSGGVNINTASAATLQLLGLEKSAAEQLVSLRAGPDGIDGTDDDVPFNGPGEIINVVPQQVAQPILPYLTVRSFTFEAQVDVEIGGAHRRYIAVLHRNSGRDVQILSVHWKEGDQGPAAAAPDAGPPK
jgi:type II secretory pathway component PulK